MQIDSIQAYLWYDEQIKDDVFHAKVYCTSSYPISENEFTINNEITYIFIRCVAKIGKHLIIEGELNWINLMQFNLSRQTTDCGSDKEGKKHAIQINAIDKVKKQVSFEFYMDEFNDLTIQEILAGVKKENPRKIYFQGESISYGIIQN